MQTIRTGSTGPTVVYAQQRLNAHGFGPLVEDGDFGPATERAVLQYQAANDLAADGVVGPRTWDKLRVVARAPIPDAVLQATRDATWIDDATPAPDAAVQFAQLDVGAAEEPDGSNNGPQIAHLVQGYAAQWQIPGGVDDAPWCAKACSVWTAAALGLGARGDAVDWARHPFGRWLGSVAWIEDWAKERGRFHTDLTSMPQGALYTMGRGGSSSDPATSLRNGHCGLVVADNGDTFDCIDGNVSNEVQRRTRDKATIRGWVRWWD